MSSRDSITVYHGTSQLRGRQILMDGLRADRDVYAGSPSCWVTPTRSHAEMYALARVVFDLAEAGQLDRLHQAPLGFVAELRLARSKVKPRELVKHEFYVPGGCSPDRIIDFHLVDVRPMLLMIPAPVRKIFADARLGVRKKDEADQFERGLEALLGDTSGSESDPTAVNPMMHLWSVGGIRLI